jgi:hypothetical protein
MKSIFEANAGGFEAGKTRPISIDQSKVRATEIPHGANQGYTLNYHITDDLDASWTATRYTRAMPRTVPNPPSAPMSMSCEANGNAPEADGQWSATCNLTKFNVVYSTTVFCSSQRVRNYCKTSSYAEALVKNAEILFPGIAE